MNTIPAEQLQKLLNDSAIQSLLVSDNLRRLLADIAQASVPEERLEQHLASNLHFDAFMAKCLSCLGLIATNK